LHVASFLHYQHTETFDLPEILSDLIRLCDVPIIQYKVYTVNAYAQ